jgi:hypothetical protein
VRRFLRRRAPLPPDQAILRYTRLQAWSGIIGAVVAVAAFTASLGALYLSGAAWRDQQRLNAQQTVLNQLSFDREDSTYSSRVALWASVGEESSSVLPPGLDMFLQNRAPVPLHRVRVIAPTGSGGAADAPIGDVPPCTVISVRIAAPDGERFAVSDREWLGRVELTTEFTEFDRVWRLSSGELRRIGAGEALPVAYRLRQAAYKQSPIESC